MRRPSRACIPNVRRSLSLFYPSFPLPRTSHIPRHVVFFAAPSLVAPSRTGKNKQKKVLEFRFPGHPAPPLGMLFKMCTSIESWLLADPKNVAAVHCLTGRGRTSTVLACYLAWVGECWAGQRRWRWR